MTEEWKVIEGFKYEISNLGRIRSNIYSVSSILKTNNNGYYDSAVLCKNGARHNVRPHRLVAQAFVPNPYNKEEVNHKDGNKRNNVYTNLEWVTPKENIAHSRALGICKDPPRTPKNKYYTQGLIGQLRCTKEELNCSIKQLGKIFKIPYSTTFNLVKYGRV